MAKWMVDAIGVCDIDGDDYGLREEYEKFVRHPGRTISDISNRPTEWQIGVGFNVLSEAVSFFEQITSMFYTYIARGYIRFELKTWLITDWE